MEVSAALPGRGTGLLPRSGPGRVWRLARDPSGAFFVGEREGVHDLLTPPAVRGGCTDLPPGPAGKSRPNFAGAGGGRRGRGGGEGGAAPDSALPPRSLPGSGRGEGPGCGCGAWCWEPPALPGAGAAAVVRRKLQPPLKHWIPQRTARARCTARTCAPT